MTLAGDGMGECFNRRGNGISALNFNSSQGTHWQVMTFPHLKGEYFNRGGNGISTCKRIFQQGR
jgi:hypothetical protein